ncbi:MAG: hypothetical protein FWE61_03755 [Micrococcales bacterium]|nr:hypothetical protein [Micrococcales bacterium]
MMLDRSRLSPVHGYLEGRGDVIDADTLAMVLDYKREVAANYLTLNPDQVEQRLGGTQFQVTRKYDGEMAVVCWDGTDIVTVNSGGTVRTGLPCLDEARDALVAAGVREAVIACELYCEESAGRTRVFDALAALGDPAQVGRLRLAPYDLVSIDGAPPRVTGYLDVHSRLDQLFGSGELCRPVRLQSAGSRHAVADLFNRWVTEDGAEGLVVRSELPLVYKLKPRHSVDFAVVGFSEGGGDMKGQVRSMLVALVPAPGQFQVVGHIGGGLTETERRDLYAALVPRQTSSTYIETDSNHVAFRMVTPGMVIEAKINDVLFESTSGTVRNPCLELVDGTWVRACEVNGIAIVFPSFVRVRDDKACDAVDVRFAQIEEFAAPPVPPDATAAGDAPASQVLVRTVWTKQLGAKFMVQKFLVWATNKQALGYPAYVFAYTNYSCDRKDPLQQEVRVSSSKEQIMELCNAAFEANIKKGWVEVHAS